MFAPNVTTAECAEAIFEALLPPLCAWVGSSVILYQFLTLNCGQQL